MPDLQDRLSRIAAAFSGRADLGFSGIDDLRELVLSEFGSLDVLDRPARLQGTGPRVRAKTPATIYHVLASNLSVSGETSLLLGLILNSDLIFKLPSAGLPEFEAAVDRLPPDLKARVKMVRRLDETEMGSCDALVVFGSDETVDFFRAKAGRNQRCAWYGHRISLGILKAAPPDLLGWAEKAAEEVMAYNQAGCLSPQFYWVDGKDAARDFAESLAQALRKKSLGGDGWELSFEEASQRRHARRILRGRGAQVWESDETGGFTVGLLSDTHFFTGPGNRFVLVGSGKDAAIDLREWKGKVSSISLGIPTWPEVDKCWEVLALELGASRLCRMGDLQRPPLSWRHDGRPRLGDLVTWISFDN